jgi:hypothetical protein
LSPEIEIRMDCRFARIAVPAGKTAPKRRSINRHDRCRTVSKTASPLTSRKSLDVNLFSLKIVRLIGLGFLALPTL